MSAKAEARRLRVLWVTESAPEAVPVLARLVTRHDVLLLTPSLPPGEIEADIGGACVPAQGVDWLSRRWWLERVPGGSRIHQALAVVLGRPRRSVLLGDRNRELARAVSRAAERLDADLVHAVGSDMVAVALGCGVPVVGTVELDPIGAAPVAGRAWRAWIEAAERRAVARRERAAWRGTVAIAAFGAARSPEETGGRAIESLGAPDEPATADRLEAWWLRWARAPREAPVDAPMLPAQLLRRASVVIASARPQLLAEVLPAVLDAASAAPCETEVIVVEQGPTGPPGPDAVRVVHDHGRGASRARNLGAELAAGEVVLFTDDDCLVPRSWIADHLDALDDGAIAASFGTVTGLTRASSDGDPTTYPATHRSGALPWHIGHGSNMAVRRSVLVAAGGWDERIGPGTALPAGEDADLIVRLLEHGALRSGVGDPVRHLEWRDERASSENLRFYELGAGVWIGKAARARHAGIVGYLRARRRLAAMRWRNPEADWRERLEVIRSAAAFARGLVRGGRLRGFGPRR